jgi:tetratricopeptide (TPR) repeat protein
VKLCPAGNATRGISLNNLAWSYIVRYEALGVVSDLETSISLGRESLRLLHNGHSEWYLALGTLSRALHHKPEYLEEAVKLSREAVELVPPHNPRHWESVMNLSIILHRYWQSSGAVKELEEALSSCKETLERCPPNHSKVPKILALHAELVEAQSSSPVQFSESPPCPSHQSDGVVDI